MKRNPPHRDSNPHLPACSIVPQPTTLPLAPEEDQYINGKSTIMEREESLYKDLYEL
jgi:hypothetical protein